MRLRFSRSRTAPAGGRWIRSGGLLALGLALLMLAGCPGLQNPAEYVAGSTGQKPNIGSQPSAEVFAPQSDMSITGGTPIEVTWRAVATTTYAVVDVFVDPDTDPQNGNEIVSYSNLPLTQSTALVDTQRLVAGSYHIGVRVKQVGEMVASAYAAGIVTVNQAPSLFFSSPRNNYRFDRSPDINPTFEVTWSVSDPDSSVSTRIYLDPDGTPSGNEVLLRTSSSQTGDSFTFDLPTAQFEAGTYRILAQVTDGEDVFSFYAPGSIVLRARLSGPVDLRDLALPTAPVHGAVFEGFNPRDNAGSFVTGLRDLDADGFDDFLILSQFAKPFYESGLERTGVGEAYMIYGRPERFSGTINLNSTGTLFRGDIFTGVPEQIDPIRPSRGITSFALLSDWDLDGVREFAFGIPFTDSLGSELLDPNGFFRTGGVVVVAGSALRPDLGFPGRHAFSLADFGTIPHVPYQDPVCPEGFIVPKYAALQPGTGGTTLFYRHLFDRPPYNTGGMHLGCRFSSNDPYDDFGETVSSWDFHGLIISAPNRNPAVAIDAATQDIPGAGVITAYFNNTYVPFFPWWIDSAPPANAQYNYAPPPNHAAILGIPHGGPYHYVLDDNRPFLAPTGLVFPGAPGYFLSEDKTPCLTLLGVMGPHDTVRFWSDLPGARLNNAKGIGDVNSDGLFDMLIGAPFVSDGAGACYIILGRLVDIVLGGELNVSELALPMDSSDPASRRIYSGIQITGAPGDRLGQAQDDAGDFNHDGYPDVLIGSPLINNRQGGAAVFFGSRDAINLTRTEIPFDEIPARGLGVVFVGETEGDLAGARVATAGDVDGDGNADILIAAPNRSVRLDLDLDGTIEIDRAECGAVYLVYGSPNLTGTISLSLIGTQALPGAVFIGRNSGDHLGAGLGEREDRSFGIAEAGDVDGDGRTDLLLGSVSASPRDCARAGEAYLIYGVGD